MTQTALNTVRITPPTDQAIFTLFEKLLERTATNGISVQIADRNIGNFRSYEEFSEKFPQLVGHGSRYISQASCEPDDNVNVYFLRSTTKFENHGNQTKEPSNWQNEIYVYSNRTPAAQPVIISHIWSEVERFRKSRAIDADTADGSASGLRDIVAVQLSQLADAQTQIVVGAEVARQRGELAMEERRQALEADWDKRRADLQDQQDLVLEKLEADRRTLEAKSKELDDRGHMHARRELRTQISATLRERLQRPGVSAQSNKLRLWFVLTVLGGIVAAASYTTYESISLNQILNGSTQASIYVVISAIFRTSAPILLVTGLLFYLLTWLKRTHSEDVSAERELERYSYDIDRASWAIETILEAQAKETGEVPALWIEGVTRSLFARSAARDEDREALDALGSLLNVSAKAEIGPNGPRFEINRPGLRKLGKAASSDGE